MSTAPVISAQNLSLTFETNDGPVHALKDVSLDIEKGDFVSFIGPSGCGKTTFLRCMADLEQPTGGEITVNGVSAAEARRARAYGYVFQAAGLYPWRTIGGNIRLPLEIMGYSKADQAARVRQVLELVELAGFELEPCQLHQLQHLANPRRLIRLGIPHDFKRQPDIAANRPPGIKPRRLKHIAIGPRPPGLGSTDAIHRDLAPRGLLQVRHTAQERRLATARRPDKADEIAFLDIKRHVFQRMHRAVVGFKCQG